MRRGDYGLVLAVAHGRISEVSFVLPELGSDGDKLAAAKKAMQASWGRPRIKTAEKWTWRSPDRFVTAEFGSWEPRVSIREL